MRARRILAFAPVLVAALASVATWSVAPAGALTEGGPEWGRKNAEEIARQISEREQRREAEERAGKEAAAHEASERAKREQESTEREAREHAESEQLITLTLAADQCVVPRLKGDSLGAARRALRRKNCKLGKVHEPGKSRGRLVVVGQSAPPGHRLGTGSAVGVSLGRAPPGAHH